MPRVKSSKARTDRYNRGLRVGSTNKKGYTIDKSQPADENDTLFCKKGDTYYYWAFAFSPVQYSLTIPRQSQLTRSEFYGTFYAIVEEVEDSEVNDEDDFTSLVESVIQQCEELRDSQEEKRENMISGNQNLENTPVAELLQERYDAMEDVISELNSCDYDEYEEDEDDEENSEEDSGDDVESKEEERREHNQEQKQKIEDVLGNMCC